MAMSETNNADIVAHTSLKTPTAVAEFLIDILTDFRIWLTLLRTGSSARSEILFQLKNQKLTAISQLLNYSVMSSLQHNSSWIRSSFLRPYTSIKTIPCA